METGTDTYWVYERKVQREDGLVTLWLNRELNEPNRFGVKSVESRLVFDCKERVRYTAETTYKEDGSAYQSFDRLDDWRFIRPQSPFDTISAAVCAGPID